MRAFVRDVLDHGVLGAVRVLRVVLSALSTAEVPPQTVMASITVWEGGR